VAVVGLGLFALPAHAAGKQAKQKKDLLGEWYAVGTVLAEHDSAIQAVGETIPRLWLIRSSCSSSTCPVEFIREVAGPTAGTLGKPIAAELAPSQATWRANFAQPRVYCLNTTPGYPEVPGTERSSWTVTVKSSKLLVATEATRITGPNCQTATSSLRWIARRLPSSSAA
jgi:hypothetical protein